MLVGHGVVVVLLLPVCLDVLCFYGVVFVLLLPNTCLLLQQSSVVVRKIFALLESRRDLVLLCIVFVLELELVVADRCCLGLGAV